MSKKTRDTILVVMFLISTGLVVYRTLNKDLPKETVVSFKFKEKKVQNE
jgi:hypothetical protein